MLSSSLALIVSIPLALFELDSLLGDQFWTPCVAVLLMMLVCEAVD